VSYHDVVLAETSLLHYWKLGLDAADSKGSAPLTYGASAQRMVTGRIAEEPYATGFTRVSTSNAIATPAAGRSAPYSTEVLALLPSGAPGINGWYIYGNRTPFGVFSEMVFDIVSGTSLRAMMGNGGSFTNCVGGSGANNLTRDVWHHCAHTVAADGTWNLYLDGANVGSGTGLANAVLMDASYHYVTIGQYSRDFDANWAFHGRIQSLAFYSAVLTPAQIAAHYAALGPLPVLSFASPEGELPSLEKQFALPVGGGGGGGSGSSRPLVGQVWPR
jgi:hypothetical protein